MCGWIRRVARKRRISKTLSDLSFSQLNRALGLLMLCSRGACTLLPNGFVFLLAGWGGFVVFVSKRLDKEQG
jgi:hypothetical protein